MVSALDILIKRCGPDARGYQTVTIGRDLRQGFGEPYWWIRFPIGELPSGRRKYDTVRSSLSLDDAAEVAMDMLPPPTH